MTEIDRLKNSSKTWLQAVYKKCTLRIKTEIRLKG